MNDELIRAWLDRAADDLAVGQLALKEGYAAHSCFLAHQAFEKSLKAFLMKRRAGHTRTHKLVDLVTECATFDEALTALLDGAIVLDQYYIPTRYPDATPGTLAFSNTGTKDLTVSAQFKNAGSGGLAALSAINVSTAAGAQAALGNIETLIQSGIDAASEFGSAQSRIDIQNKFVSKLSDSLKAGIGSLVDADMEEASARLQALQVQQQLGIQSLSIANQAPQNILALFRG